MIIHCQHCNGILLKDVKLEGTSALVFEVKLKCPHCQKAVMVKIQAQIESTIFIDSKRLERTGEAETSIRTL